MDVLFFLKTRTAFIRQFYALASEPFLERKRKIEVGEEPFEPPYSEYGYDEPPFLEEWMEADESLHILAYSCISMLAAVLHLYFKGWEKEFRIPVKDSFNQDFKQGWLNGYKAYFAHYTGIRFEEGPSNLVILEEIVLARNRVQHPQSITDRLARYSENDFKKLTRPFFLDDEAAGGLLADVDEAERFWFMPAVHVTGDKLSTAIDEVEKFADWVQLEIANKVYRHRVRSHD